MDVDAEVSRIIITRFRRRVNERYSSYGELSNHR